MITLTQMEYVLAVAKEKNFRRAAKFCNITQPTLSVQIQKFEELIETEVFDRSKNPIELTPSGMKIIEQIRVAHIEALRIYDIAKSSIGLLEGNLRIGVIPTISPYLLPLFIDRFHKLHPHLELGFEELTTSQCLDALDHGEIDTALLATKENPSKYRQSRLYREELYLYVNKDHPFSEKKHISPEELEFSDIWLLEDGHCLKDEVLKVCRLKNEARRSDKKNVLKRNSIRPKIKVGNLETLKYLVEDNYGYTLLPYLATRRLGSRSDAISRPFTTKIPSRSIYLTHRKRVLMKNAIDALKNEILNSTKGLF